MDVSLNYSPKYPSRLDFSTHGNSDYARMALCLDFLAQAGPEDKHAAV